MEEGCIIRCNFFKAYITHPPPGDPGDPATLRRCFILLLDGAFVSVMIYWPNRSGINSQRPVKFGSERSGNAGSARSAGLGLRIK